MRTRVGDRVGRRGAFLLLFGLGFILVGLGQIHTESPPATLMGLSYILRVMTIEHWGLVWVTAGVVAMISAFFKKPGRDAMGFVALESIAMLWAAAFFVAGILLDFPRAVLQGGIYMIIAVAVGIVAGWPEPPRPRPVPVDVIEALIKFEKL